MDLIKEFLIGNELRVESIAKYVKVPIEEVERIKNDMELDTDLSEEAQGETDVDETSETPIKEVGKVKNEMELDTVSSEETENKAEGASDISDE